MLRRHPVLAVLATAFIAIELSDGSPVLNPALLQVLPYFGSLDVNDVDNFSVRDRSDVEEKARQALRNQVSSFMT